MSTAKSVAGGVAGSVAGLETARSTPEEPASVAGRIAAFHRAHFRHRLVITLLIAAAVAAAVAITLMVGETVYDPGTVTRVLLGQDIPGASFTVGELRFPGAITGLFAGFAFGVAGVTFQTMLRNPLASPDVIGIASGASAAAVFGIVVLAWPSTLVSALALGGALVTALAIYLLSFRRGFAGTRLILIGIGVAAMLNSVTQYLLSRAASWDLQTAMRWLSGSLNAATRENMVPLVVACLILVPLLLTRARSLDLLRLGDDAAAGLGVRVFSARLWLIATAVALLAFATAATGPIGFVAFMSGPIATRLIGPGAPPLIPAGLVGALLVLGADLAAQNLFANRYPVGVITGLLGAPFLVYLLIRMNRSGGSL